MLSYVKAIFSVNAYYYSMQKAFISLFGTEQMLHYPMYQKGKQTLLQGQQYFTSYCIDKLGSLEDKTVADIGCGNGIQSLFIYKNYRPKHLTGIELNAQNIAIAKAAIPEGHGPGIQFIQDNAETLESMQDHSTDIVICIESAFHYRDKQSFLQQVKRILRPGGRFLIADLILKPKSNLNAWEKKVAFNNWNEIQYEEGFINAGLQVATREELTPKIIQAFQDSGNWFGSKKESKKVSRFFSIVFARALLKLYTYQLRTRHSYMLYLGNA
jgi:ubiquinone/menaquinone biosynthesis C-methylase UbiE